MAHDFLWEQEWGRGVVIAGIWSMSCLFQILETLSFSVVWGWEWVCVCVCVYRDQSAEVAGLLSLYLSQLLIEPHFYLQGSF